MDGGASSPARCKMCIRDSFISIYLSEPHGKDSFNLILLGNLVMLSVCLLYTSRCV